MPSSIRVHREKLKKVEDGKEIQGSARRIGIVISMQIRRVCSESRTLNEHNALICTIIFIFVYNIMVMRFK